MGTRVKVFTDLLNLGHVKVTKTLWQVCNGNVRWQRGSLCFAEQFVRHSKKLLSGRAGVYLAAVVKLPGVPYASLHRGPLLDEDFPVDSQASWPPATLCLSSSSACLSDFISQPRGWASVADAAGDQRGVVVHDCTETSTVAIHKVSVGTLTVAICETLDVRLEIRDRHSLGISRCDSTLWFAWCCDRHLT